MSLHLAKLFHRELPDLDGTRMSSLANTSKEGFTVGKHLNLSNVVLRVRSVQLITCIPDLALVTDAEGTVDRPWNVANAGDNRAISLEFRNSAPFSH